MFDFQPGFTKNLSPLVQQMILPTLCFSGDEILMQMKGEQVTPKYLERHGFNYPISVTEMEGLGLKLPAPTFNVKDVEQYVGK